MKASKTFRYLKEKVTRNNYLIRVCEEDNKKFQEMIDEILEGEKLK